MISRIQMFSVAVPSNFSQNLPGCLLVCSILGRFSDNTLIMVGQYLHKFQTMFGRFSNPVPTFVQPPAVYEPPGPTVYQLQFPWTPPSVSPQPPKPLENLSSTFYETFRAGCKHNCFYVDFQSANQLSKLTKPFGQRGWHKENGN